MNYIAIIIRKIFATILNKLGIEAIISAKIHQTHHLCNLAMRNVVIGGMDGDYFEFGSRKGKSFIIAYKGYTLFRKKYYSNKDIPHKKHMRFFAFDAWSKGLPADDSFYKPPHWKEGSMSESKYDFIKNLQKNKINLDHCVLTEGYFKETLSKDLIIKHKIEKASVLHFDCDLYKSTKESLNFSKQLLQIGTILIFDDYFRYLGSENDGQYLAFKEFREDNPEIKFRFWENYLGNAVGFMVSNIKKYSK